MSTLVPWLFGALLALPPGARPVTVAIDCGLDGCPSAGDIRARLQQVLGYDPIVAAGERRVVVHYTAAGAGVATELNLHDGAGRAGARRFETAVADWDAVVSATVMNIALIVEPGRLDLLVPPPPSAPPEPERSPSEPALEAEPEPEPKTAPTPPEPEPSPEPDPPSEISGPSSLAVVLGGGATYGLTPGFTAQLAVGAQARFDALSAEVGLRYSFTSSAVFEVDDVVVGEVVGDLVAADLAGCYHPGPAYRTLGFGVCATALAGAQRATSDGLPGARDVTLSTVALGARGLLEWAVAPETLPGLWLRVGVDLRVPLSWTRLRVDGRLAWHSAPLAVDGLAAFVRSF